MHAVRYEILLYLSLMTINRDPIPLSNAQCPKKTKIQHPSAFTEKHWITS
jgi:hypothetical protein